MAADFCIHDGLRTFFRPRGIAVVGASADTLKPGGGVVELLLRFNFPGDIFPVNRGQKEIQGLTCYESLEGINGRVDLVIVALSADQVCAQVRQCAALGLKNLVIISGGFAEVGGEGAVLQEQLAGLAREYGLTILGPNCVGFINALQPAAASFALTVDSGSLQPGPVGFIAQSGGLGLLALFLADREKLGVSYIISTGNEVGLKFDDIISFLVREPEVQVIGGYLEGVREGDRLRLAFREAAEAGKPVVLLKAGDFPEAVEAINSHTGALAGSREAYRAVFRQEGVLQVSTLTEMLSLLKAFAPGKLPAGNRVAVYSFSGGMGVLASDLCPPAGLELAEFSGKTVEALRRLMPSIVTVRNPLDSTTALVARLEEIRTSLEIILDDPGVDMLVFTTAFWRIFGTTAAEMLGDLFRQTAKPLLVIWPGSSCEVRDTVCKNGVPFYHELKDGLTAAAALWRYASFQQRRLKQSVSKNPVPAGTVVNFKSVLKQSGGVGITEAAVKELLAAYGISIPRGAVVGTLEEAVAAARDIGFPVVLKVLSPAINHKSKVGGVRLELADEARLVQAWAQMRDNLAEKAPGVVIDSFLIEEMLPVELELMTGVRGDPVFGPLLVLGLGGIFVELFKDLAMRPAPASSDQVLEMIDELKIAFLLKESDSSMVVDLAGLADVVSRFSRLAADLAGEYKEIEINPLVVCRDGRIAAADALLV